MESRQTKIYGLIGYPLSHSFSKKYFTNKFEVENIPGHVYELFPIPQITELPALLAQHPGLCGLNVTVPYKKEVMPFLDRIDGEAGKIGAVNCIKITSTENTTKLEGYNTDIYGFEESLKPLLKANHQKALVLGNGGAANAVKFVLNKLGISYRIITRRQEADSILFSDLTDTMIAEHPLIINTTPVGTAPKTDECPPIPYDAITNKHLLYDLIYNPEQTLFLSKGLAKGAAIKNGYEMLVLQAERSWEIWNALTI